MTRRRLVLALVAWALASPQLSAQTPQPAEAPSPSQAGVSGVVETFDEDRRSLRVRIGGRLVQLQSLIIRSPGEPERRRPIALIVHGRPSTPAEMLRYSPERLRLQALDLARRGWLAVVVSRRGFGQSDTMPAPVTSCTTGDLASHFRHDGDDLAAILDAVKSRPDADPERILLISNSAGFAGAFHLASRQPPGLRAWLNVSGGLRLTNCVDRSTDLMVAAVKEFAPQVKAPSLWIYAENDELFPPAFVDRIQEAALDGGMGVRRITVARIDADGHALFGSNFGRRAWLNELDLALRSWELPTWDEARARDIARRIGLERPVDIATIERYIAAPGLKSLVASRAQGRIFFRFGGANQSGAERGALADCAETKASDCRLIMNGDALAP